MLTDRDREYVEAVAVRVVEQSVLVDYVKHNWSVYVSVIVVTCVVCVMMVLTDWRTSSRIAALEARVYELKKGKGP